MTRRFPEELLRRLRNDIPVASLLEHHLDVPCKRTEGVFRFLCPHCAEFHTRTNERTNLARCFRCRRNFNPIDLVITLERCSFVEAVRFLTPYLEPHSRADRHAALEQPQPNQIIRDSENQIM